MISLVNKLKMCKQGSWFKFYLIIQGITIKHESINRHSPFTRKLGRAVASLPHSSISTRSQKAINLVLVLHVINSFLLDEIYLTLEIGIWLNDSFVLLVDNIPDIVTSVSLKQAVNLKYHRVSSHHQKRND